MTSDNFQNAQNPANVAKAFLGHKLDTLREPLRVSKEYLAFDSDLPLTVEFTSKSTYRDIVPYLNVLDFWDIASNMSIDEKYLQKLHRMEGFEAEDLQEIIITFRAWLGDAEGFIKSLRSKGSSYEEKEASIRYWFSIFQEEVQNRSGVAGFFEAMQKIADGEPPLSHKDALIAGCKRLSRVKSYIQRGRTIDLSEDPEEAHIKKHCEQAFPQIAQVDIEAKRALKLFAVDKELG